MGLLIVLFGIALLARSGRPAIGRIGTILAAVGLGWIAVVDIDNVSQRVRQIEGDTAIASVGMGLYVIVLSAVLAVVGALISHGRAR